MNIGRWNYETSQYEIYDIPDSWNISLYEKNMKTEVNCVSCGKVLQYGETYTSLEIHTPLGFGYGVCHECYQEELQRRYRYERR